MPSRMCWTSSRFAPLLADERQQLRQRARAGRAPARAAPAAARPGSRGGGRSRRAGRRRRSRRTASTTVVPAAGAGHARQQRRDADRARPLDHELGPLEQEHHRLGDLVLGDRDDPSTQRLDQRAASARPGRLTAIPSAIVSAESTATGAPGLQRGRERRAGLDLNADHLDLGPRDLSAIATPLTSPPPPTGTTTRARSGTWSSSSSPSPPWPAITSGSSNGWTKASPSASARSRAARERLVDARPDQVHVGAEARWPPRPWRSAPPRA